MPVAPGEHDGITGVTFSSDGHRLLGTLYLARGSEPKPTALLLRTAVPACSRTATSRRTCATAAGTH